MSIISKSTLLALAISGVSVGASFAETVSPETQASQEATLLIAVATASQAWKDAFNAGDAAAAAALYEDDAVMVVKPFGTFTGKDEILAFWTDLVSKGFDDVVYVDTKTVVLDGNSASVSASWSMNNASGIITNEHWVLQEDGSALMREDHFEVAQ